MLVCLRRSYIPDSTWPATWPGLGRRTPQPGARHRRRASFSLRRPVRPPAPWLRPHRAEARRSAGLESPARAGGTPMPQPTIVYAPTFGPDVAAIADELLPTGFDFRVVDAADV